MRRPARRGRGKRQSASVLSLPAPWKGLNTRDRLEEADLGYAAILDNFIPGNSEVNLRKGYIAHANGLPDAPVETLMEYAAGSSRKLFAGVGSEIYDVTAPGGVSGADVTGLLNARWQHSMYATVSGQYLVCVNGADGVRAFDGEDWSTQAITGADPATLIDITGHKARLWFLQRDTLKAWYLPPLAIAGEASGLDLGPIAKRGGYLQAMSGWSVDAGDGADDYLVFVTSEGECIIYAGTDPNSASTWAHVGTYQIDRPLGRRCLVKFGADLMILTTGGVVSVSALRSSASRWAAISELVRDGFQASAIPRSTFNGWELMHYPKRGWLIANVPQGNGSFEQFLYNSLIPPPDGWCQIKGQNANCWGLLDGDLFFGGQGVVCKADTGETDNGNSIIGRVQWAWSRFGNSSRKRFTLVRPHLRSGVRPAVNLEMRTDYSSAPPLGAPTASPTLGGSDWDSADWDLSGWVNDADVHSRWMSISGLGHVGGLHLTYSSAGTDFAIISAEVAFEAGGVL